MKPIHIRVLTICAAATTIALTGVVAPACTQQSMGGSTSASTFTAPTPLPGNVVASNQPPATVRGVNTEQLCHARGNGTFAPLSVSPGAVPAHIGHGDGRPLGPAPGGSLVFTSTCELVASIVGTWLGTSITYDPNASPVCGMDLNEYRLTLQQSGSDVSGEVYWKILQSFFQPDVGMAQTAPLTSGTVSGNTFTFSYGPPAYGLVASATFTSTTMTGTITIAAPPCNNPNTFELVRQ